MARNLVIFYSRRGENYVNGSIVNLAKGNTEIVAQFIQEAVTTDLFEIQTVKDYPADYTQCTMVAKEELRENRRPALKKSLSDISGYANIVIAGPCWWGTYPMAMLTQLEMLSFTEKKVFPVMTHEGSGFGDALSTLKKSCIGAEFGKGLDVHGADVANSKSLVLAWARKNLV